MVHTQCDGTQFKYDLVDDVVWENDKLIIGSFVSERENFISHDVACAWPKAVQCVLFFLVASPAVTVVVVVDYLFIVKQISRFGFSKIYFIDHGNFGRGCFCHSRTHARFGFNRIGTKYTKSLMLLFGQMRVAD